MGISGLNYVSNRFATQVEMHEYEELISAKIYMTYFCRP